MYQSPTIIKLQQDIQSGKQSALDDFWQTCQKEGTPLIEPLPENEHYRLVTFLWQARQEPQSVCILLDQFAFDLHRGKMNHLADSDVWYLSLPLFNDSRILYGFAMDYPGYEHGSPEWSAYLQEWPFRLDPYNQIGDFDDLSICELPDTLPFRETNSDHPQGILTQSTFNSGILGQSYPILVYTPPDYAQIATHPWMLFFDGFAYADFVPAILNDLLAKDEIQPHIAIFVDGSAGTRSRDLTLNQDFLAFLVDELLPHIREQHPLSNNPSQAIVGGSSAGGLAAAFAAFHHPEIFGNVLSQAGVFYVTSSEDLQHPFGHPLSGKDTDYGWLIGQFASTERKSLQFHLDVGLYDNDDFPYKNKSNLLANRHLRDVLVAKGYSVHYQEFSGGHDFLNWRVMFPDALLWLTRSFRDVSR